MKHALKHIHFVGAQPMPPKCDGCRCEGVA